MVNSPIAIFTYKRLDTLVSLIDSLSNNSIVKDSPIYFFSDGPKNEEDLKKVSEIRLFLSKLTYFSDFHLEFNDHNFGLARSIINGVSKVINKYGKVIVLEDDLFLSPNFLFYMNQALDFYKEDSTVGSISGYRPNFHISNEYQFDAFFSKRVTSWGWATWDDRWNQVNWNLEEVYPNKTINLSNFGSDLKPLIEKQINGEVDSWAIRWFYFHLLKDKFSIVPKISKVKNVGFGDSATHTKIKNVFYNDFIDNSSQTEFFFPSEFDSLNQNLNKKHISFYSYYNKIYCKLKSILLSFIK